MQIELTINLGNYSNIKLQSNIHESYVDCLIELYHTLKSMESNEYIEAFIRIGVFDKIIDQ